MSWTGGPSNGRSGHGVGDQQSRFPVEPLAGPVLVRSERALGWPFRCHPLEARLQEVTWGQGLSTWIVGRHST